MSKEIPLFTHSDQLVIYINRCHTYPTTDARSLALWLADRYFPNPGYAPASYPEVQEAFSASRATVARWFAVLRATGFWETHQHGGITRHALTDEAAKDFEKWLIEKREQGGKPGWGTPVVGTPMADPE